MSVCDFSRATFVNILAIVLKKCLYKSGYPTSRNTSYSQQTLSLTSSWLR